MSRRIAVLAVGLCLGWLATPEAAALEMRGSIENQSQVGWANPCSAFNFQNLVLELGHYNNLTRLRSVFSDELLKHEGRFNSKISYYLKAFGEIETAPPAPPGSSPSYTTFRLDEAYLDWEGGSHFYLLFGKKRVNWGVGFFMNPVDAINPLKEVSDPIHSEDGVPLVMAEVTFGEHSLSAIYTRDFDYDFSSQNSRAGGTLSLLLGGLEVKLHGFAGQAVRPMLGGTLRRVVGDFTLYGEYAARHGSDKPAVDATGALRQRNGWKHSALAGATYNFLGISYLQAEYIFDGTGYDRCERRSYYAAVRRNLDLPTPDLDRLLTVGQGNLSQHYLGVALGVRQLREDWDLELRAVATFDGLSLLALPVVQYRLSDRFTARLEYMAAFGQADSEYANYLFNHRIQAYLILNY